MDLDSFGCAMDAIARKTSGRSAHVAFAFYHLTAVLGLAGSTDRCCVIAVYAHEATLRDITERRWQAAQIWELCCGP